jgi:hypothetical protein
MTKAFVLYFFVALLYPYNFAESKCSDSTLSLNSLKNYSFILVPGIFNEFIPFYMTEYKYFLMESGVPLTQIHKFNSSSIKSPLDESNRLTDFATKVFKEQKKPLVVLAHSKGALESFYMLNSVDTSILKHVYLMQGPLNGVSAYEVFYGKPRKKEPLYLKAIKKLMKWAFVSNRFKNFSQEEVHENTKDFIKKKDLLSKITFVVSETSFEKLPLRFKLLGFLYKNQFKSSGDGVMLKSEQIPKDLDLTKVCIIDMVASHEYLVKAAPWNKDDVFRLKNFLKFLFTDPLGARQAF